MEEMIINFVSTYGWKLALIACSGIFVLGVLKFFNVFNKVQKEKRKYLYAVTSSGLSILASAIYLLAIGNFYIGGFAIIAGAIYGVNQAIYSMYENSGFRAVLRKLGTLFIYFIAKKEIEKAKTDIIDDTVVKENENMEIKA